MIGLSLISLFLALQNLAMPATSRFGTEGEPWVVSRAVTEALERNLQLIAERAALPVADALLITARLRPNPSINFAADHLDLAGTGFSPENGAGPAEYTANTSFVLERKEKRKRRIELAGEEKRVAEHDFLDLTRRLAFEVRGAFLDLLLAQENTVMAREKLSAMKRILEINRARVASGDLAEVELIRTQVAVAQLEDELTQAEMSERSERMGLHLLVGRDAAGTPIIASGEFEKGDGQVDAAEVATTALRERQDLLAAAAKEARAAAALRLQMAQAHGDLEFGTEFRRQQGVNGEGNSLGVFLRLPLQLFDRNQGEIARARAQVHQAALRTAALRAEISKEVRAALAQRAAVRERLERIETGVLTQARRVREITEYAYRRGQATFVELLDAERAHNETVRSYLGARAELARSVYRIHAVMGKVDRP